MQGNHGWSSHDTVAETNDILVKQRAAISTRM